eukprot:10443842-Ditylum_brightwellii.AAC.1
MEEDSCRQKTSTLIAGTLGDGCPCCLVTHWMISLSLCDGAFCYWDAAAGPDHVVLGTWHT